MVLVVGFPRVALDQPPGSAKLNFTTQLALICALLGGVNARS